MDQNIRNKPIIRRGAENMISNGVDRKFEKPKNLSNRNDAITKSDANKAQERPTIGVNSKRTLLLPVAAT